MITALTAVTTGWKVYRACKLASGERHPVTKELRFDHSDDEEQVDIEELPIVGWGIDHEGAAQLYVLATPADSFPFSEPICVRPATLLWWPKTKSKIDFSENKLNWLMVYGEWIERPGEKSLSNENKKKIQWILTNELKKEINQLKVFAAKAREMKNEEKSS